MHSNSQQSTMTRTKSKTLQCSTTGFECGSDIVTTHASDGTACCPNLPLSKSRRPFEMNCSKIFTEDFDAERYIEDTHIQV